MEKTITEATQQSSTFAQIIDKLRNKSEEELKQLYMRLSTDDLIGERKDITRSTDFGEATREDIVQTIQKNRYN